MQLQHAGRRLGVRAGVEPHGHDGLHALLLQHNSISVDPVGNPALHSVPMVCRELNLVRWHVQGITLDVTLRCRPACLIRTRVRCAAWAACL